MNTGEKIDYMIQCLKVAKAEYEYSVDYLKNEPERDDESIWEYLERHRQPNKALISVSGKASDNGCEQNDSRKIL